MTEWFGIASKVRGIGTCKFTCIPTQISNRVKEQLDDVFVTMRESAGVFQRDLVVVCSLQQAGSPRVESNCATITLIWRSITIGVREPIWVGGRVIDNRRASFIGSVLLDFGI